MKFMFATAASAKRNEAPKAYLLSPLSPSELLGLCDRSVELRSTGQPRTAVPTLNQSERDMEPVPPTGTLGLQLRTI
jgi:hypothetical protein